MPTFVQVASLGWIRVGFPGNAPGSGDILTDNPGVTASLACGILTLGKVQVSRAWGTSKLVVRAVWHAKLP